jgi:Na+-driven multidrug efflux pump
MPKIQIFMVFVSTYIWGFGSQRNTAADLYATHSGLLNMWSMPSAFILPHH